MQLDLVEARAWVSSVPLMRVSFSSSTTSLRETASRSSAVTITPSPCS